MVSRGRDLHLFAWGKAWRVRGAAAGFHRDTQQKQCAWQPMLANREALDGVGWSSQGPGQGKNVAAAAAVGWLPRGPGQVKHAAAEGSGSGSRLVAPWAWPSETCGSGRAVQLSAAECGSSMLVERGR